MKYIVDLLHVNGVLGMLLYVYLTLENNYEKKNIERSRGHRRLCIARDTLSVPPKVGYHPK